MAKLGDSVGNGTGGFVYTLRNNTSGEVYVGKADSVDNLGQRLNSHANNKDGFTVQSVNGVYSKREQIKAAEQYGIEHGNNGLTTKTGGDANRINAMSDKSKDKYNYTDKFGEDMYNKKNFDYLSDKERGRLADLSEDHNFCNQSGGR